VLLVAPKGDFAASSRWARRVAGPAEKDGPGALADFLAALPYERALLLPCSDDWVRAVVALPPELQARMPPAVPHADVVARLLDKEALAATLREAGVPGPRTYELRDAADLDALGLDDDELRRFFLKPRDSQRFNARFGLKAFAVTGRADAVASLERAGEAGIALLLQERIAGPPTAHVFLDGYVSRDGRTLGCLGRRRLRMFPPDFGNSTYHVSVPPAEVEGPRASLARLLEHVGYRGIFSAEFKRDERDGIGKLLEVNVRPWWYVEFAALCGVDVCDLAYRDLLGSGAEPVAAYAVGRRSVLPTADLRAVLAGRGRGGGGVRGLLRSWPGASLTVLDRHDPLPAARQALGLALRPLRDRAGSAT
jgi:D-aspartate ligase